MIRGLSAQQLGLIGAHVAGIVLALVLVVLEQWKWAAAAGVAVFALFSVYVALTLAAMTHVNAVSRARIDEIRRELNTVSIAANLRRVRDSVARVSTSMEASEERLSASERRMISILEAHRFQLEDEMEQLKSVAHRPNTSQR